MNLVNLIVVPVILSCSANSQNNEANVLKQSNTFSTPINTDKKLSKFELDKEKITKQINMKTVDQITKKELPKISKVVIGNIESGNYGGSLPNEIFESIYSYSRFSLTEHPELQIKFEALINDFFDNSIVNDSVTLRQYLFYVYNKQEVKLNQIHSKYNNIPKGSKIQNLPILLFSADKNTPIFKLNQLDISITSTNNSKNELYQFIIDNGFNFSSAIPDDFYNTYYK
ncbi:MAG: hypothetical protein N4A35_07010 [Flavobacteriales bacterium]|nr:hypothetical protein [Flavobacteriales bacterium]